MTYTVDPALIAAVEARVPDLPRRDRMGVYAAIRQAREFPKLALEADAAGVLLRIVLGDEQ